MNKLINYRWLAIIDSDRLVVPDGTAFFFFGFKKTPRATTVANNDPIVTPMTAYDIISLFISIFYQS